MANETFGTSETIDLTPGRNISAEILTTWSKRSLSAKRKSTADGRTSIPATPEPEPIAHLSMPKSSPIDELSDPANKRLKFSGHNTVSREIPQSSTAPRKPYKHSHSKCSTISPTPPVMGDDPNIFSLWSAQDLHSEPQIPITAGFHAGRTHSIRYISSMESTPEPDLSPSESPGHESANERDIETDYSDVESKLEDDESEVVFVRGIVGWEERLRHAKREQMVLQKEAKERKRVENFPQALPKIGKENNRIVQYENYNINHPYNTRYGCSIRRRLGRKKASPEL